MKRVDLADIHKNGMQPAKRELKERDYIYASEIGYPFYTRYQKMHAVPASNDFDARTLFKFFIGNLLEYGIQRLWQRSGMTVELQKGGEKCIVQPYKDLLPVSGKYDAIISSDGDWDKAIWEIKHRPLDDMEFFIDIYALPMAEYCKKQYPNGFPREIVEIKTINSMVFRSKLKKGTFIEDYYHHQLQLYTYMQAFNAKTGKIFYISKDDASFMFVNVVESEKLKKDWYDDVKLMTEFHRKSIEPEFPKPYKLKNGSYRGFPDGKYDVNWYALGNQYLTHYTGLTKDEFEKEARKIVRKLNKELKEAQKETK